MATFREIVYMVNDQLKNISDDGYFTEEHIMFLVNKFRLFILKKEYENKSTAIPESNYQTLCLDLIQTPAIAGEPCEGGTYLRSKEEIPKVSSLGTPSVYPEDYFLSNIAYVSKERFRYVGHNKWLQNIIYASIGPENHLYFKSSNPQYLYLEKARMTALFENPEDAAELMCEEAKCDPLDMTYPLEEIWIPTVIELAVKTLSGAVYKPIDYGNNASDDLADFMSFLRRSLKSNVQEQIEQ